MPSLPSRTDLKTYLGLTTTNDDSLIDQLLPIGVAIAERDTGRTFSASSNTTTRYSTYGDTVIPIHDRPLTDASRTITWQGTTLTEGTNAWFLSDRRDPNITNSVQLRPFDTSRADWYKADPQWFDKNLDRRRWPAGTPNDLVVTGILGIPFPRAEVTGAILILDAFLYWRAKSGASGAAYDLAGDAVSLASTPPEYQQFVRDWRIYHGVSGVG